MSRRRKAFKKSFEKMYGYGFVKCHYCPMAANTRDHVVPYVICESNATDNLVPACHSCNNLKADKISTCDCDFCLAAIRKYRVGYLVRDFLVNEEDDLPAFDTIISENLRYLYRVLDIRTEYTRRI